MPAILGKVGSNSSFFEVLFVRRLVRFEFFFCKNDHDALVPLSCKITIDSLNAWILRILYFENSETYALKTSKDATLLVASLHSMI